MQTCWRQGIPWTYVARKGRCFNSPIGTLRNYYGYSKENIKKAIGLMSKTTTLHVHQAFFVHFFAVPAQLRREMTKF